MSEFVKYEVIYSNIENIDKYIDSLSPIQIPIVTINESNIVIKREDNIVSNPKIREYIQGLRPDGKYSKIKPESTKSYPYSMVGRLITSEGVCSGSIVAKNMILTAAHCVHKGQTGDVFNDIYFQPGFPGTNKKYKIKNAYIPKGWVNYREFNYDFAILITEEDIEIEGSLGIYISLKSNFLWTLSYPADPPFDYSTQISDGGPRTDKPWSGGELQFNVFGIDRIDLTSGSSGGPLMYSNDYTKPVEGRFLIKPNDPRTAGRRYLHPVNGLNSFYFENYPGIMISPTFSGSDFVPFINEIISDLDYSI